MNFALAQLKRDLQSKAARDAELRSQMGEIQQEVRTLQNKAQELAADLVGNAETMEYIKNLIGAIEEADKRQSANGAVPQEQQALMPG